MSARRREVTARSPGTTSATWMEWNLAAPRCFGKGTCLARRAVRDAGALAVGVVGAGRDAPASATAITR